MARSGEEGLNLLRQYKIDLIILDYVLPGMDGLKVCKILKKDLITQRIPVLFVTIVADNNVLDIYEAGANFYLRKPVTARELLKQVQLLLSESRAALA